MNDLDTVLRQHVRHTQEVLPVDKQEVLLWHNQQWRLAYYITYPGYQAVWWLGDECSGMQDGQYWLPLPTFNPSEGVPCKD